MKQDLVNSASKLTQPAESVLAIFSEKQERLAAMGSTTLSNRPDLDALVGPGNHEMAKDNNRNFARFMESLFVDYKPEIFVDTVLWVFRTYRSHGFKTTYWAANLNIWLDMLKSELPDDAFSQIAPFYNWLMVNIPVFTQMTEHEDALPSPDDQHK